MLVCSLRLTAVCVAGSGVRVENVRTVCRRSFKTAGGAVGAVWRVGADRAPLPAVALRGSGPGLPAEEGPEEGPHIFMKDAEEHSEPLTCSYHQWGGFLCTARWNPWGGPSLTEGCRSPNTQHVQPDLRIKVLSLTAAHQSLFKWFRRSQLAVVGQQGAETQDTDHETE